jgi:hypothetical protein
MLQTLGPTEVSMQVEIKESEFSLEVVVVVESETGGLWVDDPR